MFKRIKRFFEELRTEFKRVQWPTRQATLKSTYVVTALSIVLAIFLGISDFILSEIMQLIISS